MYTKKRININTFSECQLSCKDCLKSQNGNVPQFKMGTTEFLDIVDKCVDYGFKTFELTPPYGDPLLDKDIFRRVEYISQHDSVEEVFFYTNMLAMTPRMLGEMEKLPKFNFRISVYGDTYQSYYEHTGQYFFYDFTNKLQMLASYMRHNPSFNSLSEISMRFKGYNTNKLKQLTHPLYSQIAKMVLMRKVDLPDASGIDEYSINTNELVKVEQDVNTLPHIVYNRRGICPMAVWDNGIYPNGDVTLCKWCDRNGKLIIGNVFEQSLEEIYGEDGLYMTIMREQRDGLYRSLCKECNIFDSEHYKRELIT